MSEYFGVDHGAKLYAKNFPLHHSDLQHNNDDEIAKMAVVSN